MALQHGQFQTGWPILEQHWSFGSLSKNFVGEEELFSEGFLEHMTSNKLRIRTVKLYPI